jgi:hypothetical protein
VRLPLWREVGSVLFSFCRASPAQPFSDLSPTRLMSIVCCLYFWDSPTWRAEFLYLFPPGTSSSNIYERTAKKTAFFCCNEIVAEETWLFVEPLLTNSCCIVAYFAVVAQQRAYILQYCTCIYEYMRFFRSRFFRGAMRGARFQARQKIKNNFVNSSATIFNSLHRNV